MLLDIILIAYSSKLNAKNTDEAVLNKTLRIILYDSKPIICPTNQGNTMTKSLFFKFWLRNVRDGFYSIDDFASFFGPSWNSSVAFIPFALTVAYAAVVVALYVPFGAFIKTLFDTFTKKIIPATLLADKIKKMNDMKDEEIEKLASEIAKHKAGTYSEMKLKDELVKQEQSENKEYLAGHAKKVRELRLDQLGDRALTVYNDSYINATVLDEAHTSQLDAYDTANKKQLHRTLINNDKKLLQEFLADDANNGSAAALMIFGLFEASKPAQVQTPADNKRIAEFVST